MTTAQRFDALIAALHLTQAKVARQSGLDPSLVNNIHTGKNGLKSHSTRVKLATGLGVQVIDLAAYFDETIDLEILLKRATGKPAEVHVHRSDESPLEIALAHAFNRERHSLRDVDAVRLVVRGEAQFQSSDPELLDAAKRWLDAARALRLDGRSVTAASLLYALTTGKPAAWTEQDQRAKDDAANLEADERARAQGIEPGSAAHVLKPRKK